MLKKLLSLAIITSISTCAMANEVKTFDQLKESIQQGKSITIVTTVDQAAGVLGYFKPNDIMVLPNYIATSDLHFTNKDNPQSLPTYEYVDYIINKDGTVTLTSEQYDAQTFQPRTSASLKFQLGSTLKVFAN